MVLATINISITIIAYKKNLIGDYIYFLDFFILNYLINFLIFLMPMKQ